MENKFLVLSVTTLGSLMSAIDSTIIYLGIPSIGRYFSTGVSYLTFVILAYMIASTATMVPSGAIARRFGKKKIYIIGFFTFTVSSFLIALSPAIIYVIIFRAIEGIGAGILSTVGIPILMEAFPQNERGRAVGINSISWGLGTLIGPVLGGFLVMIDWRLIFLINIPIGLVAIYLGIRRIPSDKGAEEAKIYIKNVLGFLIFIVPLIIGMSFINIMWIIISIFLLPLFIIMQKGNPIVPLKIIKNRNYLPILIASTLQALGFFGVMYSLSIYLQNDLNIQPFFAGLILSTYPISAMIANPLGGHFLDKYKIGKILMISGLLVQGSFLILLSFLMKSTFLISILMFIIGFGGSIYWVVSTTLAIDSTSPNDRTLASSTLYTLRNMALILGISTFPLFISVFDHSQIGSSILILKTGINIFTAVKSFLMTIAILALTASIILIFYRKK